MISRSDIYITQISETPSKSTYPVLEDRGWGEEGRSEMGRRLKRLEQVSRTQNEKTVALSPL